MLESQQARRRTSAWRRHQRVRMMAQAWQIAKERYPRPEGISALRSWHPWQDLEGRWRTGPVAWDDIFALRDDFARRLHDHLAACSCAMCGNPRKFSGERTRQERRAEDLFRCALAESL